MADAYPVPCDQVARPLPAPGTDVDIRNRRKRQTAVIALGLPGLWLPSRARCCPAGTAKGLVESAGCLGFERPQKPSVMIHDYS